ncbi:MAG TPA: three-Cys-motif partner protein TcmP [Anaerolineae bacterium]|nr:three-Cys-motif partner protein TcmP [Anaerolineae bacterium]HOQ97873.1 three-Cys-motif partner protein TcmP [Anaerolineae bacterium]HPL28148.1 three-Cys-motif partner protein TcmP [Anaerolineae bacterium]
MSPRPFFDEQTEQSLVKATIVVNYFKAWTKVVMRHARTRGGKIGYVDLFAGPGHYEDGSKSTPILILEHAIQDPDMRDMLVALFNDVNPCFSRSLESAIASIPGLAILRYKPQVLNEQVGTEIAKRFQRWRFVPTLFFIDPWGYKGLSLELFSSVLKDWGCDCILFFNYNRINMGLNNNAVRDHMDTLFGVKRAEDLRARLEPMQPDEREAHIVEAIAEALRGMGGQYVLQFRFTSPSGGRASHYLIFVTKHVRGYDIMKEIMARVGSGTVEGVPTLEYNPTVAIQPALFALSQPLHDLADSLLREFAGQTMTMADVYNKHHVGKRYVKANYKDALLKLEEEGRIRADPPAEQRQKRGAKTTFADDVRVTFPADRRS